MSNIEKLQEAATKAVRDLAEAVSRSDYAMPNYGRKWGPWKLWDGSRKYGPEELEEQLVNVYRASPLSQLYLVDEAHHIDWVKKGSGDDVLAYRVAIETTEEKEIA